MAKSEFETAGYQVQTLRLTTQSLGEFVAGMANEQALAFLARLDQLSVKEDFLPADALTAIESVRHTGRKPADRIFPREEKKGLTERKQERFDTRSWIVPCLVEAKITGYAWHRNRHTFRSCRKRVKMA
jgi:hypothetical protein